MSEPTLEQMAAACEYATDDVFPSVPYVDRLRAAARTLRAMQAADPPPPEDGLVADAREHIEHY